MAIYVLIHGAGSDGWSWHLVEAELRERGHDVVAVDLPCDDDAAGLEAYADAVVEATGDRRDLVVVGQSLGGFTAPLVCARLPVDLLVLVTAMIPRPGETGLEWWAATGHDDVAGDLDLETEAGLREAFLQDVPAELAAEALRHGREQSLTPMREPWPLTAWPDVATRFVLCTQDRFFPAAWMREVVRERLGIVPDELDAGHLPALSRPRELAALLHPARAELRAPAASR
jgi:pimeloyl-ACP methyl ester carboxylesterase